MIVISDTSPLCYLILIGEINLLPQLYGEVLIPQIVQQELSHNRSPIEVRNWINNPPDWLKVDAVIVTFNPALELIDPGEQAAIILAQQKQADLIIIDDYFARQIAQNYGLKVTGLLGVLDEAARQNLIDFPQVIASLKQTSFRVSKSMIESLLQKYQS